MPDTRLVVKTLNRDQDTTKTRGYRDQDKTENNLRLRPRPSQDRRGLNRVVLLKLSNTLT